jgi:hypothetical protein
MRVRAQFTREEYEKLLEFLRRWHDISQPVPPVEPSPKRLIFGQPVAELHDQIAPQTQPAPDAQAQPAPAPAGGQPQPAAAPAEPPPAQLEGLPLPAQPPAGP